MALDLDHLPYIKAKRHGGTQPIIRRIVIHVMEAPLGRNTARNCANYFAECDRDASAHYTVDEWDIYRCLPDNVVAYHAPPNTGSIGVELAGYSSHKPWLTDPHSLGCLRNGARLVAALCVRHSIPVVRRDWKALRASDARGICGHDAVSLAWKQSDHTDPGKYFPWVAFLGAVRQEMDDLPPEEHDVVTNDDVAAIASAVWNRFTITGPGELEVHLVQAMETLMARQATMESQLAELVRRSRAAQA